MQQANQSFHYEREDGSEAFVRVGTVLPDNHPDVVGHEFAFDALAVEDSPEPAKRTRGKAS